MAGPDDFDLPDAPVFDNNGIVDDPVGVAVFGAARIVISFG
jgi:hypothetical protein